MVSFQAFAPVQAAVSAYSAGTVPSLSATPALLVFGTTSPSITLGIGTWLIFSGAKISYNAATFSDNRVVTLKLRNTTDDSDVDNTADTRDSDTPFTRTLLLDQVELRPVLVELTEETTIELWGDVSVLPDAGSLDVNWAYILAIPQG